MTSVQKVKYLYWVVYEWAKYDVLRKRYTLRAYISKCFEMEKTRPNWYEHAKQLHKGHRAQKTRHSKGTKWEEKNG